MYWHGTIFSLNNRKIIYMVWTWEIHILIQLLKYISFYNVYILIVKPFIRTKIKLLIISKRWACLQDKIYIHDWFYFENTVTRNMEICGLNSYPHDLINILFKKIEFLHIVTELTTVIFFIRKVWVCSHVVIGALRGVGTYDFWT